MNNLKALVLTSFTAQSPYDGCFWEPHFTVAAIGEDDEGNEERAYYYVGYVQFGWGSGLPSNDDPKTRDYLETWWGGKCAAVLTQDEYDNLINALRAESDGDELEQWVWYQDKWLEEPVLTDITQKYAGNLLDTINTLAGGEIIAIPCRHCNVDMQWSHELMDGGDYSGDGGVGINVFSFSCEECVNDESEWWKALDELGDEFGREAMYWTGIDDEGLIVEIYNNAGRTHTISATGNRFNKELFYRVGSELAGKLRGLSSEDAANALRKLGNQLSAALQNAAREAQNE